MSDQPPTIPSRSRPDGVTVDQDALRALLAPPVPPQDAPALVVDRGAVDDPGHLHAGVLLGTLLRAALATLEQTAPVTTVAASVHRVPAIGSCVAGADDPVLVEAEALDRTSARAAAVQPGRHHGAVVAELEVEAAGHGEVMRAGDLLDLAGRTGPQTPEIDVDNVHGPCVVCGWQPRLGLGLAPRRPAEDAGALLWVPSDATAGGDRPALRRWIGGARAAEPETLVGVWAMLAVLPCAARWGALGRLGRTISSCTGMHLSVLARPEAYTPLRVVAAVDEIGTGEGGSPQVHTRVAVVDDEDVVHVVGTVSHALGSS
jgi:hypothetical protein